MTGQTIALLAGSISASFTSVGVLVAIPVFFYRRGKTDEQVVLSLKAITKANEDLAQRYDRFAEKTTDTLHTHDVRITRLEPPVFNGNGRRTR
jgi:hypothetical protein